MSGPAGANVSPLWHVRFGRRDQLRPHQFQVSLTGALRILTPLYLLVAINRPTCWMCIYADQGENSLEIMQGALENR